MTESGLILLVLVVALLVIILLLDRATKYKKKEEKERLEEERLKRGHQEEERGRGDAVKSRPNPPIPDSSIEFFSRSMDNGRWRCVNCQVENEHGATKCVLCGRTR